MAKKDKKNEPKVTVQDIKLNGISDEIFKRISSNTYKSPTDNLASIDRIDKKIDNILSYDMDELKQYSGDDLSVFLYKTISSNSSNGKYNLRKDNREQSIEDLFNTKDSSIFALFNERFRNRALLFKDLEIISDQLVEITEALNTTRDDILCADDVGAEISRSLNFTTDISHNVKYDELLEEVKRIEKEYKLNHKIREHIVPKTLKYGEYYVYVVPERKIFEKAEKYKNSINKISLEDTQTNSIYENLNIDTVSMQTKQNNLQYIKETLTENINVCNDIVPLALLENSESTSALMDLKKYNSLNSKFNPLMAYNPPNKSKSKKSNKTKSSGMNFDKNSEPQIGFSDGVVSNKSSKISNWEGTKGCYIKMLDPKRMIPIEIYDYIIGYYYVDTSEYNMTGLDHKCSNHVAGINTGKGSIFGDMLNKSKGEQNIVNILADSIIKSFDKKYLEDNKKFKELIINSLLYEDTYKRKVHYQFIPADNVCRFTVNEDEEGHGTSMLYKSLFYAKLYLSILIFNLVSHLSKSQDTRIHYIKQSGIDKNIVDKSMDIARQIKAKQISIADLMDYSTIYGKIGSGRDVFMPVGESGERGIEFDVISGQQIDMHPEVMEDLKTSFINGTGVPSVIMNYINEVDYAKTLVMANAKHLRRVMTYQESFNESITRFYRMILKYTTDMDDNTISTFYYTLQKPKALPNNNLSEIVGYGDQIIDLLVKAVYGENQDSEDLGIAKDLFRTEMSRKILSMLPWEDVDEAIDRVKLKVSEKKATKDESGEDGSGY